MRSVGVRLLVSVCFPGVLLFAGVATADGQNPTPEQQAFGKALDKAMPKKAKPTDGTAAGKLGTRRMRRANRLAAEILERRMRKTRHNDLLLLRRAGATDVVVVRGSYDRVQDVLQALKVKHVVVPPHLVAKIPLMSTQTLMINCPGNLPPAGVKKVRRFV